MKLLNIFMSISLVTFLVSLSGCGDDENISSSPTEQEMPDLSLASNEIHVKVGTENAVPLEVKSGGGEYSAFSLDSTIAKVQTANGNIMVEGISNGQTSLILSDKYSRYKRVTVNVYTTDKIEIQDASLDLKTLLGYPGSLKTKVILGNGGYTIKTNIPKVIASITPQGEISITATSGLEEYTAIVSVGDQSGISTDIVVKVRPSLEFFDKASLESIQNNSSRRYYLNKNRIDSDWYSSYINESTDGGKIRYGYDSQSYYGKDTGLIEFSGDKTVGDKKNAVFNYQKDSYGSSTKIENQPITLKIIKNDGTNIWAIFTYVDEKEEKLYGGYFCDTIEPK